MSLTSRVHSIISGKFKEISLGVDATCGNGHDTLFLAGLCTDNGKVLSLDTQKEALDIASKKIKVSSLENKVRFVNDGHENIADYVSGGVDVFIFNLGYLPGSDKRITTGAETTVAGLKASRDLLSSGGIISVLCYQGHYEGKCETRMVKEWLGSLERTRFSVDEYLSESPDDTTPVLYIINSVL